MDLEMTEEQRLIVETVRRFVSEQIVPLERDLDPDASELAAGDRARLVALTRQMGFFNPDVPVEFGGAGMNIMARTMMSEEMSQHRAGLYAPCYGVFGQASLAAIPLYFGTQDQKERYLFPTLQGEKRGFFGLSEPSGGSDPARAIKTVAVKDGDDWVINGSKLWISDADRADFGVVFARTDTSKGRGGISCFIVDTDSPGFEVRRIVHVLRSTRPPTELSLDNVRVPHRNLLGEEGGGFNIANDRLARNRIPYAAECIGVAVAAHKLAVPWSKQRETFGATLASRQAIQWMLVDNEVDMTTSRWLVRSAADKADKGLPYRFEAAMCKLVGTEAAGRVVDRCIQIHGGLGVSKDLPLERWWRELRIRRIGEGPNEVQRVIMARDILQSSLH